MIMPSNEIYYSDRGIPLLYIGGPRSTPIITLENCDKWYGVEIISVEGVVSNVAPYVLDEVVNKYPAALMGDHNYHPHFLHCLAIHLKAWADIRSIEVAGARWLESQEGQESFFYPPKLKFVTTLKG